MVVHPVVEDIHSCRGFHRPFNGHVPCNIVVGVMLQLCARKQPQIIERVRSVILPQLQRACDRKSSVRECGICRRGQGGHPRRYIVGVAGSRLDFRLGFVPRIDPASGREHIHIVDRLLEPIGVVSRIAICYERKRQCRSRQHRRFDDSHMRISRIRLSCVHYAFHV